jgi:hypothetical protein
VFSPAPQLDYNNVSDWDQHDISVCLSKVSYWGPNIVMLDIDIHRVERQKPPAIVLGTLLHCVMNGVALV